VIFLEPPSLNQRIVNQAAFLSLISPGTVRLDDFLDEHCPELARKIIIPASVKLEIRDKLDLSNINERMIYPGLEGTAKWLKRYYSPLNLMAITIGDRKGACVLTSAKDGVMKVRAYWNDAGDTGESLILTSKGNSVWETSSGEKVTVRWPVGTVPGAKAAAQSAGQPGEKSGQRNPV
jgi:hypothetical protein